MLGLYLLERAVTWYSEGQRKLSFTQGTFDIRALCFSVLPIPPEIPFPLMPRTGGTLPDLQRGLKRYSSASVRISPPCCNNSRERPGTRRTGEISESGMS